MENAISYLYGFTISKKISYKDKTVYYTDKGIFLFAKVEDTGEANAVTAECEEMPLQESEAA